MMADPNTVAEKVWRYMSFARFLWLLQNKRLWFARADLLGDPWEITLAGDQLEHVISHHPPLTLPLPEVMPETAMQRSERIITMWRRQTFVNCWSASDYESHALWRIYCRSTEGVVLQTTLAVLRESVGELPVHRVAYQIPGSSRRTPTLADLVAKKRPMFAYEQEVRVVLSTDGTENLEAVGHGLEWDPEKNLETIRVHPDAHCSLMKTVNAAVEHYAPALKDRIAWSAMNARRPF